ncbi:GDP-mannose 4,6-dehydratase [Candidatus Uhrbacteria bacterium]|nr:GDP-mannose 4,6-dehydratase [Candidatus Uhrbacteria bacterium]
MTHVLITGGAGFIGSHLADALIARGDRVTVLDNLSTGRLRNIEPLVNQERFQFVNGTILNEQLVDKLVERADQVYHLAAAVGVELVVAKPLESLITNIKGSEIVLEMVHRYHKKVLVASTSEIYGKNTNGPLREDDDRILGSPLKSRWGYSTAKAIDELLAYIYFKEKAVPTVIIRLFNTVGPRQVGVYGMVVPRFVEQALQGKDLTVFGTGKQLRSFLHVKDAVAAMVKLMDHPAAVGKVFNIGNEDEITIEELARKVIAMTKSQSKIIYVPYEKAYEEGFEDMQRRFPSTERLRALTGWQTTATLDNILESVIQEQRKSV